MKKAILEGFALTLFAAAAHADPVSGTLFYTTFSGGQNVWSVPFNFNGTTTFSLGASTNIASTAGADGLLFLPDGNLAVAGQGFNHVSEVTTGGTINPVVAAGTGSFHLALNSTNTLLYNLWNGGGASPISALPISGGGLSVAGTPYSVACAAANPGCSTDVRGVVFNPTTGKYYYGTAPDGGVGDFGTVVFDDVAHTATLTRLLQNVPAHGVTFDPFTGDIIFSSAGTIDQFDPTSNTIVSTLSGIGNFDQSSVDGKGHLFVASNSGFLEFVDYDATKLIGSGGNFTAEPFLAGSLDDIAPLSGAGSQPVPEPASLTLLANALVGLGWIRRRRKNV